MKNIFISSTFRDMQAERDLVQERVLPALREEARKYGDNVGVIDLRWGVDTSTLETEEGAAKVLKVCLDEIDRSHPYMLIFLGERYGWIPEGELIERAVRGREDKYVTDDYSKSVTALEIEYGALSEKYGELNHCVVCFREPVEPLLDEQEKSVYVEQTQEGKRKLEALKERIKRDLGEDDRLITYSCAWDKSARQLVDFTSNGQPLEVVLTNCFVEMFRDDWKEYESLSWQDKEQLAFRALMESKLRSFVGREELLEEYYQSVVNGTCPIILQGEVGSGKTAIMCKLVERLQKEGKNVFAFFSGAGSMSTNAESLVKQMVYYMENLLGVEDVLNEVGDDSEKRSLRYSDWMNQLKKLCYLLSTENKVYVFIDALDQLDFDEHVEKLDFLVQGKFVQCIASCKDERKLRIKKQSDLAKSVPAFSKNDEKEVKCIPSLSEDDAKAVIEGIMASYSRNAYVAIVEEILKKKCIGNSLYISLLIQRLNMMDTDELKRAVTEKDIVDLSVGIIREMSDDTEAVVVDIIRNGIEKISESRNLLYEVIEYLAVSRNGLRMSDLQGIFAAKGRKLPVLNLTLLMKYLDNFFYVHEDGRIDFTNKLVRQGLLKVLIEREAREEVIKEHLKTLNEADELRIREGMFFARVQRDEMFAKRLIEHAYVSKNEELKQAIKNECLAEGGIFFCKLFENEVGENSIVRDFFLETLCSRITSVCENVPEEELRLREFMVIHMEKLYEKTESEWSLRDLSRSYLNLGNILRSLERREDALLYYDKAIKCREELHKKIGNESSLEELEEICWRVNFITETGFKSEKVLMYSDKEIKCREELHERHRSESSLEKLSDAYMEHGKKLRNYNREREALSYLEKALKNYESLHEKKGSERSLQNLSVCYRKVGETLDALGRTEEALSYYEKGLKCEEELYEKDGSASTLLVLICEYKDMSSRYNKIGQKREALLYYEKALKRTEALYERCKKEVYLEMLVACYKEMDRELQESNREREALVYGEKAVTYQEELDVRRGSITSLCDLAFMCRRIGNRLVKIDRGRDALLYYEKAVICYEEFHLKAGEESSLKAVLYSYKDMGDTLKSLGRGRDALLYYEKILKCRKDLYEKSGSGESLGALAYSYNNMGNALKDLGQAREALSYYEKALKCREKLHEKRGSEGSLGDLAYSYNNMGNALKDLGQAREALSYYEKALKCREKLHEKSGSEGSLRDLSISYNNMGNILCDLDRYEEALEYFSKNMRGREELYRLSASDTNLSSLAVAYNNYGFVLCELEKFEEALEYLKKALQYTEELHRKNPTENTKRALAIRQRNLARALRETNQLQESLAYEEKALVLNREVYGDDASDKNRESIMKSLNTYAETLLVNNRTKEAYEAYTEALEHCKPICEKNASVSNIRIYVNILKGLFLSLCKLEQRAEAEEYLLLAKEEAKKLYERSGADKDKMLLEELLSY